MDNDNDVNVTDYSNYTPLHDACEEGFLPAVQLLLKHGAKTDIKNKVCYSNNEELMHDNTSFKAISVLNSSLVTKNGFILLQVAGTDSYCCISRHFTFMLQCLVTVQDNQTAYTLAMESGHSDIGAVIRDNTLTRKSSKVSSGEKNKRGVS